MLFICDMPLDCCEENKSFDSFTELYGSDAHGLGISSGYSHTAQCRVYHYITITLKQATRAIPVLQHHYNS